MNSMIDTTLELCKNIQDRNIVDSRISFSEEG